MTSHTETGSSAVDPSNTQVNVMVVYDITKINHPFIDLVNIISSENTVYRENFAPVLFSPSALRANLKLGQLNSI